jgi:signal transduction histidine kinase
MPVEISSEFIALCQSQLHLALDGMGVQQAAVYLSKAGAPSEGTQFFPVVSYPVEAVEIPFGGPSDSGALKALPLIELQADGDLIELDASDEMRIRSASSANYGQAAGIERLGASEPAVLATGGGRRGEILAPLTALAEGVGSGVGSSPGALLFQSGRVVMLLRQHAAVLGVCVVTRPGRSWSDWEKQQLQTLTQSLSLACVLEHRGWQRPALEVRSDARSTHLPQVKGRRRGDSPDRVGPIDYVDPDYVDPDYVDPDYVDPRGYIDRIGLGRVGPSEHLVPIGRLELAHSVNRSQGGSQSLPTQEALDNLLHQFRNSLTALQTFGKLILRRVPPEEALHEIATSLVRETARLQELSQKLEALNAEPLMVLPLDAGMLPPAVAAGGLGAGMSLRVCALPEVLVPLLASAEAIAQDRDLTIHAEIATRLPPILADPTALREVLNNLLENALKYTPQGGHILVQAGPLLHPPHMVMVVSDTGPGIPEGDLPHIGERRYRGVQSQGEIPGTGLGLSIVKRLVEQMQGQFQVMSPALPDSLDQQQLRQTPGTTVLLTIPLASQELAGVVS